MLITTSVALADAVDAVLVQRVSPTRHSERVRQALTGQQSGVVLVASSTTRSRWPTPTPPSTWRSRPATPPTVAGRIRNAGAIFVGPYSPVSLGDYCAGSNHVLPTGGSRPVLRRAGRTTFLRQMQVIEYSRDALREVAPHVLALSEAEDLPAHGEAVAARFRDRRELA